MVIKGAILWILSTTIPDPYAPLQIYTDYNDCKLAGYEYIDKVEREDFLEEYTRLKPYDKDSRWNVWLEHKDGTKFVACEPRVVR